jgi:hypothetical protein
MGEERIHRTVSADGTEIVGRMHGDGPSLVLLRGERTPSRSLAAT